MLCLCLLGLVIVIITYFIYNRSKRTTIKHQKIVFVTGCDSGIGYKLAVHLDRLGCVVYAGCLFAEGDGASNLKGESSDRLKIVPLDVTSEECVSDALKFVKEDLKGRDLWAIINNAGVFVYGEFDWMTPQQCRSQIDVNLCGTVRMTKAFLPLIRKCKGRIINVTTINTSFVYPGMSVYCASKYALEGFSAVLRLEMAKYGVRVIVIQPGDFARLTNIMDRQEKHQQEMWNYMNEEDKTFYDGYFQTFHKIAKKNYGLTSAKTFESTSLLKDIEDALFSSDPSPRYTVAPLPFKIFSFLVSILPTRWTDSIILYVTSKVFDSLKE